jgi:hypothetical protein
MDRISPCPAGNPAYYNHSPAHAQGRLWEIEKPLSHLTRSAGGPQRTFGSDRSKCRHAAHIIDLSLPSQRRGAQGRTSCQPAVASYREFRRLADVVNGAVSYFLPLCCCAQQRVVLGSAGWEELQHVPERFESTSGTKNESPIRSASNSSDRLPVNMWIFCLRAVIERGRRTWYVTGTGKTQVRSNLEPFVSNLVLDPTIVERANPRLGRDFL